MAVIIALGNDKDLGFIDFHLFPGLEGTDPGSLKNGIIYISTKRAVEGDNLYQGGGTLGYSIK